MKPIVSILVPSRKRTEGLYKLLHSLQETASDAGNFEVVIRFSDDDLVSRNEFLNHHDRNKLSINVSVIVGKALSENFTQADFFSELAEQAKAPWVWGLSDDTFIRGNHWDNQFKTLPVEGLVVYPQFDQLDESLYEKVESGPFVAVPTNSWIKYGGQKLSHPIDAQLWQLLAKKCAWKPYFLKGITVVHERRKARLAEGQDI